MALVDDTIEAVEEEGRNVSGVESEDEADDDGQTAAWQARRSVFIRMG